MGTRCLWTVPVAFLIGLCGSWMLSSGGVLFSPDSGQYLAAASNIAAGRGVTSPIVSETSGSGISEQLARAGREPFTDWPPLYPTAIAVAERAGASPGTAVRIVNAVAAGLLLAVLTVLGLVILDGSTVAALALAGASVLGPVLVSPVRLLSVNVAAMPLYALSETLFLPVVFAALLLGGLAADLRRGRGVLLAAVGAVVAATLVRYMGVAAGLAGAFAVVVAGRVPDGSTSRGRRVRAAALVAAGPVCIVVWSTLRSLVWGAATTKGIGWFPPAASRLGGVVEVMAGWLGLQDAVPWAVRLVAVLVVIAATNAVLFVPSLRSRALGLGEADTPAFGVLVALTSYVWIHPVVVVAAVSVVDGNVPLDQRTLGPAGVALVVVVASEAFLALRHHMPPERAWVAPAVVVAGSLAVIGGGALQMSRILDARTNAVAEARRAAAASPERSLPARWLLLTNRPGDLYVHAGRPSLLLPLEQSLVDGRRNPRYDAELDRIGGLLARRDGAVILFPELVPRAVDPGFVLGERLGLVEVPPCAGKERVFVPERLVAEAERRLAC